MAKRIFVKNGETPNKFRCTKQRCKWEGKQEEKATKKDDEWTVYICPKCGNESFYGLR